MPSALARPRVRRLVALATLLLAALPVAAGAPGSHLAAHAVPTTPAPARSQGDGDAQRPMGHEADGGESDGGPRQAEEWFVQQRAYPLAAIPFGARGHALAQVAALRRSLRAAPSSAPAFGASTPLGGSTLVTNGTWSSVGSASHLTRGPAAFTTDYGPVGGRVASLAIAPTAPYTVYAGTAGGGVWTSPDGGATWTPRTDSQPSLAIGAMAIAPTAPYTAYALTGEGNFSADSYYGAGLLESANGGATWAMTGTALSRLTASRLAVDPATPSILYAAMGPGMGGQTSTIGTAGPGGLYRSTDGGVTWMRVLQAGSGAAPGCADPPADVPATDVAVATANGTTTVYAALGDNNPGIAGAGCAANGLYRSTDQGATWTRLAGFDAVAVSGSGTLGRIAVATMPGDPNVVYAAAESLADGTLQGLYKSTDGGTTWQSLPLPADNGASQYWYDLYVAVDPAISSTVYLGGIDIFKSTDAGATWTNLTNTYSGGSVHPDQHALVFQPGSSASLIIGNDGGVYSSDTGGAAWTDRSSGLGAIQLYGATVSAPAQGMVAYAGSQDNDVAQDPGTGIWTSVMGGDGGYAAIDPTNVNTAYAEVQGGWLYKTVSGGASWTQLSGNGRPNDPAGDRSMAFITPFVLDQSRPQRLLLGTYRLWETDNGGSTWGLSGSGQDLTGGDASAYISALAIAPSAPATTTYVGTSNGHVWASRDGNVSWTDGAGIPNRYVTSIAVDPADARTAWASLSGFNTATPSTPGHVFQTTDAGQTWHDVSLSLPDVPVNALAVDESGSVLFAGSDVGVFVSADDGATWSPLGSGLPTVPVFQLQLRADGTLYAATHGRGLWSIPTGATSSAATSTATPTVSATSTASPSPTSTATQAPANTPTSTPTNAPTGTSTAAPTDTAVPTDTAPSSPPDTARPTSTQSRAAPPLATATATGTPQGRATPARVESTPRATSTVTARRTTSRAAPRPRCTPVAASVRVDALLAVDRRTRLRLVVIANVNGRGSARGTLRFVDPRAPLALSAVALTSLRVTSHGATITGWQRAGRGRAQVTLVVTAGHPARADMRSGRYHRTGTLAGTLRLQPATACRCPPAPLSAHVQATLPAGRHVRATLLVDVTNDAAGHPHGRLRWSDPAAHLAVDTISLTAARASGQGIVITAWQPAGKRRDSVTLTVSGGRAPRADLRLGRYHRSGSLTGTVRVDLPTPC